MNFKFRGLMVPVFTPFVKHGSEINLEIIPQYAKYLQDKGIRGILVNGTTGEGPSLCMSERVLVTERWASVCKQTKQTLMIQVGGAPMPQVVQLAKLAEDNGVDALLCLPDIYYRPATSDQLIAYLSAVGRAAPKTPLLYYHIPSYTNVNIDMVEFLTKVHETNAVPTLAGIKFTSIDLNEGSACLRVAGGKYAVFLGADQIMCGAAALGFDSAIAATLNVIPEPSIKIFETYSKQSDVDVKVAMKNQEIITRFMEIIVKHGYWISAMKAAMNMFTTVNVGPPRNPLIPISEEHIEQLEAELTDLVKNL